MISSKAEKKFFLPKKIEDFICSQLYGKTFYSDDQLYLHMIMMAATGFAVLVHVFLLIIYFIFGVKLLFAINILSFFIHMSGFIFINKRKYTIAGLIIAFSAIAYSFISIFLIGVKNYVIFYFFIILIMQLIIPYAKSFVRGIIIIILWISIITSIIIYIYFKPLLELDRTANIVLSIYNIHVGFIGTVIELTIGNILKEIITRFNQQKMEEFKTQAYIDHLTTLYNRRYAEIFFEKISQEDKSYCVAILDIDDFKIVNDKYGHASGDIALKVVSEIIKNNVRKTDIVFRWGGEEFLIILEVADLNAAYNVLEKIRINLSEAQIKVDNNRIITLTATAGVSVLDKNNIVDSIYLCDKKLYEGKNSTKNVVVI